MYGEGNSYTAEFWQYDPRTGRRWNIDPVTKPWMSPYHAFSNRPITNIDPNGAKDGWYEDENGEFINDPTINTEQEFNDRNIKGKWLGNQGVIKDNNGNEVGEFTKDGRIEHPPIELNSIEITAQSTSSYWNNEYKNASMESGGMLGVFLRKNVGTADEPGYVSEINKQKNIDVAFATVTTLASIVSGGSWSAMSTGGRVLYIMAFANNVDGFTSDGQGNTVMTNMFVSAGLNKTQADYIKLGIDFLSLSSSTKGLISDLAKNPNTWTNENVFDLMNVITGELSVIKDLDGATQK